MLFNYIASFSRIIKANVKGTARAIVTNLAGIAESLDETSGEQATDQPLFGQIGIVARPKPATAKGQPHAGYAEIVSLKSDDGLTPIAGRDLRLNRQVNPQEGDIAVVQYGGGFLSLGDNADGAGTTAVMYAPKRVSAGGSIEKAHAVILDTSTDNMSVSIVHANGPAVLLTHQDKVIVKNASGNVYVEIAGSGITINGNTQLVGGLVVAPGVPPPQPVALAPAVNTFIGATSTLATAVGGFSLAVGTFGAAVATFGTSVGVALPAVAGDAATLVNAATALGTAAVTLGNAVISFGAAATTAVTTFPTGLVSTKLSSQ